MADVGISISINPHGASLLDLKNFVDKCYETGAEDDFDLALDDVTGRLLVEFDA